MKYPRILWSGTVETTSYRVVQKSDLAPMVLPDYEKMFPNDAMGNECWCPVSLCDESGLAEALAREFIHNLGRATNEAK